MKKVLLLIAVFLSMTGTSFAHKISVFADVDNGKVNIMGYFTDGTPCKNSQVEVFDAKTGKLLLTGKTDKEGNFSFKPPKITDLKVVVNAELGHRAETIIPASELSGSESSNVSEEPAVEANQTDEQTSETSPGTNISKEELQKIVESAVNRAVEKELKPIHQELLGIEMALTRPSIAEIFGGIGWIFGLFGTAAYFYSRKEKNGK